MDERRGLLAKGIASQGSLKGENPDCTLYPDAIGDVEDC